MWSFLSLKWQQFDQLLVKIQIAEISSHATINLNYEQHTCYV